MPTPVSAECPSASEKNAMPLLTTSVPSRANSGIISSTATKALRIKSYCHQPNRASSMRNPLPFRKCRAERLIGKHRLRVAGCRYPVVEQHHPVRMPPPGK